MQIVPIFVPLLDRKFIKEVIHLVNQKLATVIQINSLSGFSQESEIWWICDVLVFLNDSFGFQIFWMVHSLMNNFAHVSTRRPESGLLELLWYVESHKSETYAFALPL